MSGTLTPRLEKSKSKGNILESIYEPVQGSDPRVGVSGSINLNVPANLTISILGSIRTIRDFAEGGKVLNSEVQRGLRYSKSDSNSATINRTWFDSVTTTDLTFTPLDGAQPIMIDPENNYLLFGVGTYQCECMTQNLQSVSGIANLTQSTLPSTTPTWNSLTSRKCSTLSRSV